MTFQDKTADTTAAASNFFADLGSREFTRRTSDKWLGGVCSGIAEFTGWDVALVRALTVGAAFVSFGAVVLVYLALWMLAPAR